VRITWIAIVLTAGVAHAGNKHDDWFSFASKESGNGPRLELTMKNGNRHTFPVVEDLTVISYLPQGIYGRLPRLSITLGDTNRVLLRFGKLPKGIKRAELVLSLKLSPAAPVAAFNLGVYPLQDAWSENRTSWSQQPRAAKEPVFETEVAPRNGELRWDVTKALKTRAPHGWLIRASNPIVPLEQVLRDIVAWTDQPAQAMAQAKREKKHVLTFLQGSPLGKQATFEETTISAIVLADPAVHELLLRRFVALRIGVRGQSYTAGITGGADPLAPLGTRLADAKPPALIVSTASGRHVATLQSIGTYSPDMVYRFLAKRAPTRSAGLKSLRRGEYDKAEAQFRQSKTDEARYYLGCLLYRKGEHAAAKKQWAAVAGDSPWHMKCRARLSDPARMAMFEVLTEVPGDIGSTERVRKADVVRAALAWLAGQQQADGSWVTGMGPDAWQGAVTALAAHALLVHGSGDAEVERATDWLRKWMKETPAAKANTWSAGYTLDFFVERFRRDPKFKADAQRAVEYAEGGQCTIGAWSYSREWGERTTTIRGWPPMPKGRYHSMNTGPSMVSLLLAREAGLKVSDDVLKKGGDALMDMREQAGIYTYTWPHPRNWNKKAANSIGRAPACEHALFKLGRVKKSDLEKTLGYFMNHRANLRRSVKVTAGWTMPSAASAYFFHFAYWHAAIGLKELGDEAALNKLRKDLLQCVEADNTWVDWPPYGKHYATAMALLLLGE